MERDLRDQVVVITGAGSGIGIATVNAFLKNGANVVGGDLEVSCLEELETNGKLVPVSVDLRSDRGGEHLVQVAIDHFQRVDVLHNNVGLVESRKGFLDITDEQWKNTLEVNLLSYVRASRAAIPHMKRNEYGVILNTASEAARMPNPKLPDYSVSKAAIIMLSKVISREFTSSGIRSNVISPAFIRTSIYDGVGGLGESLAHEYGMGQEESIQQFVKENGVPAGRLGTPEEVADLAVFLASDSAHFISGSEVTVDGGVTPVA